MAGPLPALIDSRIKPGKSQHPTLHREEPDNALAESVNSLYKAELIYGPEQGPWHTVADVELATLAWVHWFNTQRLHGYLDDIPPAEYEDIYHAERKAKQPVGNQ